MAKKTISDSAFLATYNGCGPKADRRQDTSCTSHGCVKTHSGLLVFSACEVNKCQMVVWAEVGGGGAGASCIPYLTVDCLSLTRVMLELTSSNTPLGRFLSELPMLSLSTVLGVEARSRLPSVRMAYTNRRRTVVVLVPAALATKTI